jgi:hypothetical protein
VPAVPRFDQRGGDSFAWRQQVSGSADCGEVTLLVNGQPVPGGVVPVTGGRFSAAVPVVEGRNEVVGACGPGGEGDGSARLAFTGRLAARPTARIAVAVDEGTVTLDGGGSEAAEPDGAEVVQYVWSPDPARRAPLTTAAGGPFRDQVHGPRLRLRAPAEDGEYYARLTVTDAEGRADTATTYFAVEDGKARAVEMDTEHPGWIDSATTEVEVLASDPGASFAYLRPAPPGGRPVLVVLNFGGPATVELTPTPALDAALDGRGGLRDLLTGRPVRLEAGTRPVTVGMDAESAHVLTPEAG